MDCQPWGKNYKTEILKQSLTDVFNLEMNLLPVLLDMRAVGVRVDLEGAESLKKELVGRKIKKERVRTERKEGRSKMRRKQSKREK